MSAANALLRSIHARLMADATLVSMLAEEGIRDRLTPRMPLPAIVIGDMESRDNSTATEDGEEHLPILSIWTEANGRREGNRIAARLRALLHGADLLLEGYVLVNLLHLSTRTRREAKSGLHVSDMRLRAVTE